MQLFNDVQTNEHAVHFSKELQKIPAKLPVLASYPGLSDIKSLSVPERKILHFIYS